MRSGSLVAIILAVVAVCIAAGVCLAFPLTSNPGPEAAQVLGVVGGAALCLLQAGRAARRSQDGFLKETFVAFILAGAMVLLFIVVTAIGGAVRPSCSASRGFLPFFFLTIPVLVLHLTLGTWIGRLVGRAGRAAAVALLLEVGCALWLFVEWYREPGFRVVSHLFVVVSGDLLRGAAMPAVLVAFRAATLLFAVALLLAGAARFPRIRRAGLGKESLSGVALYALAAAASVVGALAHVFSKDDLIADRAEMEEQYTLEKKRGSLVVHADPLAVRPKDVDAALAEGALWVDRAATRLGVRPSRDIHVWLHATRAQMERWTGASHVDFALPWRSEIHVAGVSVPHGTLGHEIAHVIAGELSESLLRVPGRLVFLQNAAITEGVAMAVTPELAIRDELTLKEQAAAMKRSGKAPPTVQLFAGLSFWAESPERAYVAAGAFIESLVARSLPDPTHALAELYRTASVEKAAGSAQAAEELVRSHDAMLESMPLPDDAAIVAADQFKRPSILQDVCEEKDAARVRAARTAMRDGDLAKALEQLHAGDDVNRETLLNLADDAIAIDDDDALLAVGVRFAALAGEVDEDERLDQLGNTQWTSGARRDALASWARVRASHVRRSAQRTLAAKRVLGEAVLASAGQAPVSTAAMDVLLPPLGGSSSRDAAFQRLHYAMGVDDGAPGTEPRAAIAVARYIHARRLALAGALDEGVAQLRRVLDEKSVPKQMLEQSSLLLGTALVKNGAPAEAAEIFIAAADAADRPAMRLLLRDRAERATRAAAAPEKPARVTSSSDPLWADRLLLGVDGPSERD